MSSNRLPLWQHLVSLGYANARIDAERLVRAGLVKVLDEVVDKPGTLIRPESALVVSVTKPFVSRGGFKLQRALDRFSIDPIGLICTDVGASTGGFTDLLLQRGAKKVFAIDVGYGELDWKLRSDERVVVMERTNVRHVERLPERISLVVGDLSFISLKVIFPVIHGWLDNGADVVLLVKPQFEARREDVPDGGVVVDPNIHREVLVETVRSSHAAGLAVRGVIPSPIRGGSGNKEFLMWARAGEKEGLDSGSDPISLVESALAEDIDTPTP